MSLLENEQLERLTAMARELSVRQKYYRIDSYYPDEGPLSWPNYPRHMEFFAAGKVYRERCALAANRCISPWTWVETAEKEAPASETWTEPDVHVRAWAGECECDAPLFRGYLVGIEPSFRVVLDNDRFFDCSRRHRVLTSWGWLSLDRLLSLSSGFHCWHRLEDYEASCVEDGYLCGPQLPLEADTGQGRPPLPSDAPKPWKLLFSLEDAEEPTLRCIRTSLQDDRLSTKDDLDRHEGLFSLFLGAASRTPFLPLTDDTRLFLQSVRELGQNLVDSVIRRNSTSGGIPTATWKESLSSEDMWILPARKVPDDEQPPLWLSPGCLTPQWSDDAEHIGTFFPYQTPPLIGGRRIAAIVPLGCQPILDAHVPGVNNYKAGGVFHHNCGKTEGMGGYELTCHLTGRYPHWWVGYRFDRPIRAWAAGNTGQTVRDILQEKLVGPPGAEGTGLIPRKFLKEWKRKPGNVPDALETIYVLHEPTGGVSRLGLKSFDQKRKSFEGTEQDVILLDEECPADIYGECVIRTMTTQGLIMLTFTPLQGLTDVVLLFLNEGKMPTAGEMKERYVVNATWDDAPHLSEKAKEEMLSATEPHLKEARSRGIPHLGAGAIYPILEDKILVDPFKLPVYWPVVYGMDVGWNRTAAIWGSWDRDSDVIYLWSEHYVGKAEPPIHAAAIRARGKWIPGVIDPGARGRSQADGRYLMDEYLGLDLDIQVADNALEAGIYQVWTRLSTARLKIFCTLSNWLMEYRLYRRDESGHVAKNQRDHLMDPTRYLVMSGLDVSMTEPTGDEPTSYSWGKKRRGRTTGY